MYFVVNTHRPYTDTFDKLVKMYDDIEAVSSLNITAIVNNCNLLNHTTPATLQEGMGLISELSECKNVPVVMWTAMENTARELIGKTGGAMLLPMKEYIKLLFDRC
jgi:hypothetical protein